MNTDFLNFWNPSFWFWRKRLGLVFGSIEKIIGSSINIPNGMGNEPKQLISGDMVWIIFINLFFEKSVCFTVFNIFPVYGVKITKRSFIKLYF